MPRSAPVSTMETSAEPDVSDPLATILARPVCDPDQVHGDTEVVEWMVVQLAHQIAAASDREATLRRVWLSWRARLPPGQRELADQAHEYVRYVLTRSLAS